MSPKKAGPGLPAAVTSRDVARSAGVSQSAVSRAFARVPGVSEATRQRIFRIAEELDYQPNALASGLITRKSGMVGIVLSQLNNPFLSQATEVLLKELRRKHLQVLVFSAAGDSDLGEAAVEFGRYRVDGCFVLSPHLPRKVARLYARLGPTVILFNRSVPGMKASAVSVDNVAAGAEVADFLIVRGHKRFGYLHGLAGATTDRDRFKGFRSRLVQAGMAPPVEGSGGYDYDEAAVASGAMLQDGDRPTAIFCGSDSMAMATMDVARFKLGIKVPEDLAVVGFDDAPTAAWPSYDLTTIRQPIAEMVEAGIELLLDPKRTADGPSRNIVFEAKLIVRGSA